MKLVLAVIAATAFSGAAYAGEWADACAARLEADGRDTSGCSCLEDEIAANPDLEAEFTELAEMDDPAARYAAASDAAKEAMNACTR
ncbi:MAG: hypothetical protein R3C40_10420 [Parvularculaceae bacterium]|nr:hypothetical protein [Parvularculaceae bacterium]